MWLFPLWPISLFYRSAMALRRYAYRQGWLKAWRAPVPVVVVGNVYVGGTGKTPFTLALVKLLQQQGWRPGIVSRGYGARQSATDKPELVLPESDPLQVGDEPLLMARRRNCPVVVHRQRVTAVQHLLSLQSEIDIVVCDDGLQHLALARDLEIMVLDQRGFGNRHCLPAGPLREPAIQANSFSVWACNGAVPPVSASPSHGVVLIPFVLEPTALRAVADQSPYALPDLAGKRILLFAGIGAPERFFTSMQTILEKAQAEHWQMRAFPDHHPYQSADLASLIAQSAGQLDLLICTEKDAVKCQKFAAQLALPLLYLAVEAQIDESVRPQLWQTLAALKQTQSIEALSRINQPTM
ncbi:tetraacyldisaccharide 4'-kinase [Parvibium lacunae]|nr:tetraacyldisaccharide 4'-kinase [Parvibium lacunae]